MRATTVKAIFLSIAGLPFRITFRETEFKFGQKLLYNQIVKYYKGFIIQDSSLIPVHEIIFDGTLAVPLIRRNKEEYALLSETVSSKKTICHYHVGIAGFQIILRKILQQAIIKNNSFMLHASANIINGRAYIFTAPSGGGKSTIMTMLYPLFTPLADDSIIIHRGKNNYVAYQTPFFETNNWFKRTSKAYPLYSIYLLYKSTSMKSVLETNKSMLLEMLIPQLWTDGKDIIKQSKSLIKFINRQNIHNLYFPKNRTVVKNFFSKHTF